MDEEGESEAELDGLMRPAAAAVVVVVVVAPVGSDTWRLRRRPDVIRTRERKRTRGIGRLVCSWSAELSTLASRGSRGLGWELALSSRMMIEDGVCEREADGSSSMSWRALPGTMHGFGEAVVVLSMASLGSNRAVISGRSWSSSSRAMVIRARMSSVAKERSVSMWDAATCVVRSWSCALSACACTTWVIPLCWLGGPSPSIR